MSPRRRSCGSPSCSGRRRPRSPASSARHAQAPRAQLTIVTARVEDESGQIDAVWFNQEWLAERLRPGTHVRLRGQRRRNEFVVKSYDLGETLADGRLRAGLSGERGRDDEAAPGLRRVCAPPMRRTSPTCCRRRSVPATSCRSSATRFVALHRPDRGGGRDRRRRLAFEELLELSSRWRSRGASARRRGPSLSASRAS